jgi:hydrogenase nickel incorporation protein HypB
MCLTCGCGADEVRLSLEEPHHHEPDHEPDHGHSHETLVVEERLLARNDHLAGHVRAHLDGRGITAVNLMSSPGAGKTSLLERTIAERGAGRGVYVVEGDQETAFDADRITRAGARAIQVNTGSGCHLDASMVDRAVRALDPAPGSLLFVENVGNLVCPALFDVGEHAKVVVISVTEGDDKPLKYPTMFAAADLVLVNKTDLLPHVDFDLDRLREQADGLRPGVVVLTCSARTGEGLGDWYAWLDSVREGGLGGAAVGP